MRCCERFRAWLTPHPSSPVAVVPSWAGAHLPVPGARPRVPLPAPPGSTSAVKSLSSPHPVPALLSVMHAVNYYCIYTNYYNKDSWWKAFGFGQFLLPIAFCPLGPVALRGSPLPWTAPPSFTPSSQDWFLRALLATGVFVGSLDSSTAQPARRDHCPGGQCSHGHAPSFPAC